MVAKKKAFTLIELILIVLILGAISAICIPRLNFAVVSNQQAECLVSKIVTDLRRTRTLAISNAANNTVGFALNVVGSPSNRSYEIVNLDTGATVDSYTINSDINCTGGEQFEFGPSGSLLGGSDTELNISTGQISFTITIVSTTGMVKYTED
ncbi:MAG: hypothetical protein ACYSSL_00755 [Planctomycetota bacterium]|jgi:Tfp pilus assembly protein PilE